LAVVIACSNSDCFGNCPTVYADSAGTWALQAEGFSYTLGPAFETRDVDRLGIRPDRDGKIRLEVRNEALETEYFNQLELFEVRHAADETALPDRDGAPLAGATDGNAHRRLGRPPLPPDGAYSGRRAARLERRRRPHPRGSSGQRSRSAVLSGGQLANRPDRVRQASAAPRRPNVLLWPAA